MDSISFWPQSSLVPHHQQDDHHECLGCGQARRLREGRGPTHPPNHHHPFLTDWWCWLSWWSCCWGCQIILNIFRSEKKGVQRFLIQLEILSRWTIEHEKARQINEDQIKESKNPMNVTRPARQMTTRNRNIEREKKLNKCGKARLTNGDQKGWSWSTDWPWTEWRWWWRSLSDDYFYDGDGGVVTTNQTRVCRGSDGQMTSGRQNQTFVVKVSRQRMDDQRRSEVWRLINRTFVHYPFKISRSWPRDIGVSKAGEII